MTKKQRQPRMQKQTQETRAIRARRLLAELQSIGYTVKPTPFGLLIQADQAPIGEAA